MNNIEINVIDIEEEEEPAEEQPEEPESAVEEPEPVVEEPEPVVSDINVEELKKELAQLKLKLVGKSKLRGPGRNLNKRYIEISKILKNLE